MTVSVINFVKKILGSKEPNTPLYVPVGFALFDTEEKIYMKKLYLTKLDADLSKAQSSRKLISVPLFKQIDNGI